VAVAISGLVSATVLDDTDIFEIEQSGVSKKITKLQMQTSLFGAPVVLDLTTLQQEGDVVSYNGTDWVPGAMPRWRVVPVEAYTATAVDSSFTIEFVGGGPTDGLNLKGGDYFSVGSTVRVVISATTYYGVCTAVSDTLLTISGAILPTATAIDSVSVGSKDMVKHVQMSFGGTTYNGSTTLVLTKGCIHRWHGATGYLVGYAVAHMNTSSTTEVTLQMNGGSNVVATGVIPAAGTSTTYGAFTESAAGTLIAANLAISDKQTITAKTPEAGTTADYLVINMLFVVP
jgi:hypothetical protein